MTVVRTRSRRLLAVAVLSLFASACAGADGGGGGGDGGPIALGEPAASFPDDFGTIQTVRELPDGRVLVADPLGNELYAVDLAAGTREVIGVQGEGPGEYRQPDSVWPLPGGATLLVDLGNGRTMRIGSDLSMGETSPIAMGEPGPGRTMIFALPQGVDAQGRIYTQARGGPMMGAEPDSGTVVRVDPATMAVDTVGRYKLPETIRTETGDAGNRNVSIQQIPLSPQDAWGVAPDGSVVFARVGDYRVDWVGPDGSVTSGPSVPYDPVGIGDPEKEEWVTESGRTGGGIGIGMMIDNGAMTMQFSRGGGGGRPREIDNYSWPETKPPVYSGRIEVDPEGRAWVRRHVDAGAPATYDVFDRSGARVATFTLPNNKRVIGFGADAVYVVAYDEFDLNYLERFDLPAM